MKELVITSKFKKDYKAFKHNKAVESELREVIGLLMEETSLPVKYKDHPLIGEFLGCRDCHLFPDVVLIYEITAEEVRLIRIGKHSNLFG